VGRGALLRDLRADSIWYQDGYRQVSRPSGLAGLLVSRPPVW